MPHMAQDAPPLPKHKLRVPRARRGPFRVFVGTRKGAFTIQVDARRRSFEPEEPCHLGWTCFHVVPDPRQSSTVLAAATSPEGRPTVLVSTDGGRSWTESYEPPRFAEEETEGERPDGEGFLREVSQVFWLSPGHPWQPGTWYAGTSPHGLFVSRDNGLTWAPIQGLHGHPDFDRWTSPDTDRTPDGPKLHSVLVDPRDPDHLYAALSSGGVLETSDGGETWAALPPEIPGVLSDPHSLAMAPTNPDRLWMQSHGGVFRFDADLDRVWHRVGQRAEGAGDERDDAGFPIVVHPADPDCAWTFPMDGSEAWTRMPPGGRPAVRRTVDGGRSWEDQAKGLPKDGAWWTVKRQCMAVDGCDPLGIVFGTSTGEVWASMDEGRKWSLVARGLPHVYSVEIG